MGATPALTSPPISVALISIPQDSLRKDALSKSIASFATTPLNAALRHSSTQIPSSALTTPLQPSHHHHKVVVPESAFDPKYQRGFEQEVLQRRSSRRSMVDDDEEDEFEEEDDEREENEEEDGEESWLCSQGINESLEESTSCMADVTIVKAPRVGNAVKRGNHVIHKTAFMEILMEEKSVQKPVPRKQEASKAVEEEKKKEIVEKEEKKMAEKEMMGKEEKRKELTGKEEKKMVGKEGKKTEIMEKEEEIMMGKQEEATENALPLPRWTPKPEESKAWPDEVVLVPIPHVTPRSILAKKAPKIVKPTIVYKIMSTYSESFCRVKTTMTLESETKNVMKAPNPVGKVDAKTRMKAVHGIFVRKPGKSLTLEDVIGELKENLTNTEVQKTLGNLVNLKLLQKSVDGETNTYSLYKKK